ncbi:hypothetical protein [Rathayibacter sp. Leaf248]|uniref:hypothetical protein n=1 Tax=Rathayibacter sp. Leaf248 TaxID=2876555 RepID=UPI001E5995BC|nr:hypothetical protein [Rathayibacter sp. Leaf248]
MTNTEPLDDHNFARALNWAKKGGTADADLLIAVLAQEVKRLRDREWTNMPDDKPSSYLGYPQPGAAPKHYGPDAVVVDGDWLVAEIELANRWRAHKALDEYEKETR